MKRDMEEHAEPIPEVALAKSVDLLASAIDVETARLRGSDRSWELSRARTIVLYVLTRRLGFTLKDVAKHFRRAPGTISSSISRFADHAFRQPAVSEKLDRLVDDFHQRAALP